MFRAGWAGLERGVHSGLTRVHGLPLQGKVELLMLRKSQGDGKHLANEGKFLVKEGKLNKAIILCLYFSFFLSLSHYSIFKAETLHINFPKSHFLYLTGQPQCYT